MPEPWLSGTAMALDYYHILGVPSEADAGEIKRAFRLLALRWHPDKNPGDPWANQRFLQLGEAYAVLINPTRRAAYDLLRTQERKGGKRQARSRRPSSATEATTQRNPWHRPTGSPSARRSSTRYRGRSSRRPSPAPGYVRPEASSPARDHFSRFFSFQNLRQRLLSWYHGNLSSGLEWEMVPTPIGADLIMDLKLPRRLAARGAKINLFIKSNNHKRLLRIKIPAGVKEGACLRVKGGGKGHGENRGHLYINIGLKD